MKSPDSSYADNDEAQLQNKMARPLRMQGIDIWTNPLQYLLSGCTKSDASLCMLMQKVGSIEAGLKQMSRYTRWDVELSGEHSEPNIYD